MNYFDSRDMNGNYNPKPSLTSSLYGVGGGGGEGRFPDYARRLLDVQQMDFEAAFDQIISLLSRDPSKAYTSFYYRKQTKNQWARDDPAFAVISAVFVAFGTLAYAVAFHNFSFWGYLWSMIYAVVVDWMFIGIIIASLSSYICNRYLRQHHAHSVEQEVEWMYSFDVHTNAFLCSFMVTCVLQYFLLPLLLGRSILSCLLSNTLYAAALIWYFYISHLGYRALPFLGNTQAFLYYPSILVCGVWLLAMVLTLLGLHINMTRITLAFHYS